MAIKQTLTLADIKFRILYSIACKSDTTTLNLTKVRAYFTAERKSRQRNNIEQTKKYNSDTEVIVKVKEWF